MHINKYRNQIVILLTPHDFNEFQEYKTALLWIPGVEYLMLVPL
jgi:hypothetical protein